MKTLKLLILQGIPASSKSTFAKKLCKDNPKTWIRVCRDDIRSMLGTYWVPSREKLVTRIEQNNIIFGLKEGYNVVVDATNLNKKSIRSITLLAKSIERVPDNPTKLIIEFKEFKIPLWKAIYRDWKRGIFGRSVGIKVIKGFYNKYYAKT